MIRYSDIISSCCHNPNTFANNSGKIYANGRIICSEKCSNYTGNHDDCCYLCTNQCNTMATRRESEFSEFIKMRALQKAQKQRKVAR